MHPTLAGLYPFLLGSPARCAFLSYIMFIYMFRIPCYISTKLSAVALTVAVNEDGGMFSLFESVSEAMTHFVGLEKTLGIL